MNERASASVTTRLLFFCTVLLTALLGCAGSDPEHEPIGTTAEALYRAGDTLQAEALTSGSSPNPKLENNNTTLGFFDAGTWFCFAGVDMTSVNGLDLRMAAANAGGVLSVRLGSSSGSEIGRYTVSAATGGWSTWQTRTMSLAPSSGVQTLCLRGESGAGILNLDWIKLNAPAARYRAGDTVQAEALTSSSSPNPKLENNSTTLGYFDAGTWFCFDGVDMSGVAALELRMASANSGGVLSVRLGGSTGTEIARHTVSPATGGWTTWQTRSVAVNAATGVHTLCLRGESGAGILNLDWLKLATASSRYRLGDTIQAEALTSKSSPNPVIDSSGTHVGYFDAGTWFCFNGVDMAGVAALELRLAAASSGGVFSVRIDSSSGPELARATVTGTGGWTTWQTQGASLAAASGVRTLCVRGESGAGICNLDSIKLSSSVPPPSGNDVVGKIFAGYQGWFNAGGDGSPMGRWVHWSKNESAPAANSNVNFEIYPDMREYSKVYQTNLGNLNNGQPATLFSSYDQGTVNKHFEWMRTYNIDGAALQRFGADTNNTPNAWKTNRDSVAVKVKSAAETYGRKFYVMYDITDMNSSTWVQAIKTDWADQVLGAMNLTSSSAYARQDGKPVVCLWGIGFTDRPGDFNQSMDIINWFKNQGYYVIGGVPTWWRDGSADSKPGFLDVYKSFHMISPWFVGRFGGLAGTDHFKTWHWKPDFDFCQQNKIAYQPVLWPGSAWSNLKADAPRNENPRFHGDFMWRMAWHMKTIGITTGYIAMFDEYDEGTAIAKAAENSSMVPPNQYFLTLDADGVAVSSDFYLRLAGDINRLFKGQIALTESHPTPHR